jgi:hypothetical protein
MSVFPNFSNVQSWVKAEIDNRKSNPTIVNGLNAWVRIASGVGDGIVMYSNPDFSLFQAAGDEYASSIYGTTGQSGTIGTTWDGAPIIANSTDDIGFRPRPNVTTIEIDEGAGALSRKAKLTVTCYTLAQLEVVCKYFLEPGFTVFLEWGWNRPSSLIGFNKLSTDYVSQYQNFKELNERRSATKGNYDNYLGFITGGGIDIGDSVWNVNIELTGFTELPAYFMAADNVYNSVTGSTEETAHTYNPAKISAEVSLGKKRFMMMFNQLPSNRRTGNVSALIDNKEIANPVNFINFDEAVKDEMNNISDGKFWGLWNSDVQVTDPNKTPIAAKDEKPKAKLPLDPPEDKFIYDTLSGTNIFVPKGQYSQLKQATIDGAMLGNSSKGTVQFPSGTKIVDDNKFIRFGVLMEIINTFGAVGYKIGRKSVSMRINTKNTIVSAFEQIFSANKAKLFIPNELTPKFSLVEAASTTNPAESYSQVYDNRVMYDGSEVHFPSKGAITNGNTYRGPIYYNSNDVKGINVPGKNWGFLEDLYVNFDFAKGIMETKNFYMKDALYQILNGMSSAAGGMWDFQIIESSTNDGQNMELRVVDLNLMDSNYEEPTVEFEVFGTNSVFMDASLDLTIGGAKMNQIIGQRLNTTLNSSQPTTTGALFAKGLTDKVLTKIESSSKIPFNGDDIAGTPTGTEIKKLIEQNLEVFLQKVGIYPKVGLKQVDVTDGKGLEGNMVYIPSLDDLTLFDSKKVKSDTIIHSEGTSALMPINFSFTIHGVSGIKRGDKFKVRGIPKAYSDGGFFQVLSVKHVIDGMTWKTEVTGGFRQKLKK